MNDDELIAAVREKHPWLSDEWEKAARVLLLTKSRIGRLSLEKLLASTVVEA
jgi:hypothetical protein